MAKQNAKFESKRGGVKGGKGARATGQPPLARQPAHSGAARGGDGGGLRGAGQGVVGCVGWSTWWWGGFGLNVWWCREGRRPRPVRGDAGGG